MANKIIITGASSEIGLAICRQTIKPQDEVCLQYCKNGENLQQWSDDSQIKCQLHCVDFSDSEALNQFCTSLPEADILINCAAYTSTGLLPTISDEEISRIIDVNIVALTKISRAVVPAMMAKRKGCIINISSVAASRGNKGQSVYAGSKGYVESFSRSLAAEYGSRGVRVNVVAPGPIEAGSLKELLSYAEDQVKASLSTGKLGTPDDVAAMVAFLTSAKAAFINGKVFGVDGGFCSGV